MCLELFSRKRTLPCRWNDSILRLIANVGQLKGESQKGKVLFFAIK